MCNVYPTKYTVKITENPIKTTNSGNETKSTEFSWKITENVVKPHRIGFETVLFFSLQDQKRK